MNRNEPRATATILQFKPRAPKAPAGKADAQGKASQAGRLRISSHDSWYHQAAIDEDKSPRH